MIEILRDFRTGIVGYATAQELSVLASSFSVRSFFPEAVISSRSIARVIPT